METEEASEQFVALSKKDWLKIVWGFIAKDLVVSKSLAAVAAGIVIVIIATFLEVPPDVADSIIYFPEESFVRMMQMISFPLMFSSVLVGVTEITNNIPGKIALRTAVYFSCTTLVAINTGISLAMWLRPGGDFGSAKDDSFVFFRLHDLIDLLENVAPSNLIYDIVLEFPTSWVEFGSLSVERVCYIKMNNTEVLPVRYHVGQIKSVNLIVNSFVLGMFLKSMGDIGKPFLKLVKAGLMVTTNLVALFMNFLPVIILFMTVDHAIHEHDWQDIYKLLKFVSVVALGLIIHGVIVLPTIYFLLTKCSPREVIQGVSPALQTAFISSSSSDTLPLTLQLSEEKNRINPIVTNFMLPIGAKVHRNGSVLYLVVAAIFSAQLGHYNLCFMKLVELGALAILLSTGPAGMRPTGTMSTFFLLTAIGLPVRGAAVLVVVEWLLARVNCVVNVLGDCIGAALVNALSKDELLDA